MRYYAMDDDSGTTHAARAARAGFNVGAWALEEAARLANEDEGVPFTYYVLEFATAQEFAAWVVGDGDALPPGQTWATIGTKVGDVEYGYPGEFYWRPAQPAPDTSGTPFHDDEPGPDFAPVD